MRDSRLAAAGILTMLGTCLACDAPTPGGAISVDIGLLQVTDIQLDYINEYYPERRPTDPLNGLLCQVELNVVTLMPDECTGYGEQTGPFIEGSTIRFTIRGIRRRATAYCGGPVVGAFGLCLPGVGAEPPPPALPSGHYVIVVNNFTGSFDVP